MQKKLITKKIIVISIFFQFNNFILNGSAILTSKKSPWTDNKTIKVETKKASEQNEKSLNKTKKAPSKN